MRRSAACGVALASASLTAALLLGSTADVRATRDRPPPGYTGGYSEPHCGQCHFESGVNTGPGTLAIDGLPAEYESGATYSLTITLAQKGIRAAGFELSVRFEDGAQAGTLTAAPRDSARLDVTTLEDVQYIHHIYDGTLPSAPDTARWYIDWTAPPTGGAVVLHGAANAADDDSSPLGDFIYLVSARTVSGK